MKDDWVAAALFDDSVVAELLSRLKQSSSSSSSSFSCQPSKPLSLPLGWGHRQPRSKPPTTTNKKDSTTNIAPTTTRCSPTTPLSWSGGAASPSDGAYDDCSNSSARPLLSTSSSSSDPSRSKGAFAIDATNNKKSKKKKTFAELKEEEDLLLKERVTLKRKLASLHVTLKEQKARSENLKRFKIDLNLQTSGEVCGTTGDRQILGPNKCSLMEVSTCDHAYPSMPLLAVQDGFVSSGSSRVEKDVDLQKSCFVLPDLNMTPSEEEFGPEVLHAIQ